MRKTMALGLVMLAAVACEKSPNAGQEAAASPQASASPEAATEKARPEVRLAPNPAHHKISVKLKKQGGQCVPDDPGTTLVQPGDYVRWVYKNQCGAKKRQKIDRLTAPISGDCQSDTEIADAGEAEGKDCQVDPSAGPGKYKYKIAGDAVLDPELEIPPPPPPDKGTPPPGVE